MARRKNRFMLKSRADQYKVMRYMGAEKARLEIPMLHKDHVQNAANIFRELAEIFDDIASRKQRNLNRIFDARLTLHGANDVLKRYAADDIQYLRDQSIWDRE